MRATIPNFRQPPRQLQPQGVVAAPPSPPPAPAATIDTGILEMGTSVSVNDEMRRAVTAEVAELEASCSKIASVIQTNEATETELNKSHHHANADMVALLRSACDAVETVQFNEQILLGLTKTWTAEYDSILQNSHPNELSHQQQQRAWMDDPMMTGTNEQQQQQQLFNVIPASPAHCAWTNSQERIREIAQLRDDCISITAQKETHKRLKEDHDAKEQAIADTVKALQVALANAKYQTAQANEDAEADEKRLRGLKAKLADAEASNNAYRQSVKSSEDKLHALQASNKANDSKRKDEQASWVAESQHATQELNSLKRETAVQQDQLDGLSKTIEEATLLLEQRRSHEADLKQQRAGRTELFAKKLELETEIVAHQTSIAMREQSSNKVIEKEMEIAQLKDANDKADIEKLTADLCDKKKKLEELDSLISETSLPEAKFLLPCTLDEQQEKLDKKQREVDDKQGKIQEQEVKLQELLQMLSEQMEKTEKECQEVQNLLTDETVALQEDLEKHSVFVDSVILKDDAEFRALLRQSALMRYGAKILLNTEKKESKVAKAEAAFQASNRSEN